MNTPNGMKVQIMLEELKETYGTQCMLFSPQHTFLTTTDTHTLLNIMSNKQKEDWFLKLYVSFLSHGAALKAHLLSRRIINKPRPADLN